MPDKPTDQELNERVAEEKGVGADQIFCDSCGAPRCASFDIGGAGPLCDTCNSAGRSWSTSLGAALGLWKETHGVTINLWLPGSLPRQVGVSRYKKTVYVDAVTTEQAACLLAEEWLAMREAKETSNEDDSHLQDV